MGARVTFYANKRWGYGRTRQLLSRFRCIVRSHDFGKPNEGVRHCSHACGGMTMISFEQAADDLREAFAEALPYLHESAVEEASEALQQFDDAVRRGAR